MFENIRMNMGVVNIGQVSVYARILFENIGMQTPLITFCQYPVGTEGVKE